MNISESETPLLVEAKTYGHKSDAKGKRRVSYQFIESFHSLCLDKRELLNAQIQACERLSKYVKDKADLKALQLEITELRMALDMLHY